MYNILDFIHFIGFLCLTVCGLTWAKVRAMFDHSGNPVSVAELSDAVQIIGWKDLPTAGDQILEVENEKKVRMVMRYRQAKKAMQMAKEHQIEADKKHEEYLKVSPSRYNGDAAFRLFTLHALASDDFRNI